MHDQLRRLNSTLTLLQQYISICQPDKFIYFHAAEIIKFNFDFYILLNWHVEIHLAILRNQTKSGLSLLLVPSCCSLVCFSFFFFCFWSFVAFLFFYALLNNTDIECIKKKLAPVFSSVDEKSLYTR